MAGMLGAQCSIATVLGSVEYRTTDEFSPYAAAVVHDVSANGRYVKVARIYSDNTVAPVAHWAFSNLYYRLADSLSEFILLKRIAELEDSVSRATRVAQREAREDVNKLSVNTVTRALVHANDNDYCAETAVALISAGHKLPDITLQCEVTVSVSITLDGAHNYYALRHLFGATRGNVSGAKGLPINDYPQVSDLVEAAMSEASIDSIRHTGTDVEWFAPTIRPVADDIDKYPIMNAHASNEY
jgi:hypothetical protein